MQAKLKFDKLSRDATYRHKLRCHAQALSNAHTRAPLVTPEQRDMMRLSSSILRVTTQHKRAPEEGLRATAQSLLASFPPLTLSNDPQLLAAQRLLRAIGHFKVDKSLPIVRSIEEHYRSHVYLLDAQHCFTAIVFAKAISREPGSFIEAIDARVSQVASDFLPAEALIALSIMHGCGRGRSDGSEALLRHLSDHCEDLPTDKFCEAFKIASYFEDGERRFATPGNFGLLAERLPALSGAELADVCAGLSRAAAVPPRRLMNAVARRALVLLESLSSPQLAVVSQLFHAHSYRHDRLLIFLSRRLLHMLAEPKHSHTTVSTVCTIAAALAHFYVASHEVRQIIVHITASEAVLKPNHVGALAAAAARLGVGAAETVALVQRCEAHLPSWSVAQLSSVLSALGRLDAARVANGSAIMVALSSAILGKKATPGGLPENALQVAQRILASLPPDSDGNLVDVLASISR